MNILFLSAWFPYPPDNGSRIRIFNLIRQLSRWHEITLLSFTNHERDREHVGSLKRFCREVEVVPGKEFRPWSPRALGGFLSSRPRWLVDVYDPKMRACVERALAHQCFDVVIASQVKMAPYIMGLKGVPKVLEELETSLEIDPLRSPKGFIHNLRCNIRLRKFSHFVAGLLRDELQGCTVVSEPERANVLSIVPGYEALEVIPNGVDIEHYTGDFGPQVPGTLTFTGVLSYSANFDAMAFFLEKIWPYVRANRPGAKLWITGRTEGVPLERLLLDKGVNFTGYLDDIRPHVAHSQVCIVPLRVGGGTRLKILEAMALGTPVVSTSKGAEGLDVTAGQDILIADEPHAFVNAVLRLLDDADLRARLSENGRRLVSERYNWRKIGARLNAFLERVTEETRTWCI